MKTYYTSRRKHRACNLKPAFVNPDFPIINFGTPLSEYSAISAAAPKFDVDEECSEASEDGSTVLEYSSKPPNYYQYRLREADIEKYSNKYVNIHGVKYDALTIVKNKIRDFNMCERYKDHDLKSMGRATHRWSPKPNELQSLEDFD
jgi:hypothetical protein